MHKLDRSCTPPPSCLKRYKHGHNRWEDIGLEEKHETREALKVIQGCRCAYCECSIDINNQHIEHFRQRSQFPRETFDWHNLFWSCGRDESCGKHKDKCDSYDPANIIKPDVEDPELFFLFVSDGSIVVRENLTEIQKHRAEETLRVFNLDAKWGPLRCQRKVAVSGYLRQIDEILELMSLFSAEEFNNYIEYILKDTKDLPFCTVIKHALTLQGVS